MSCSWTVLLPSDTHRKLIKSIIAVLLPVVTHLLTAPRIFLLELNFTKQTPDYPEALFRIVTGMSCVKR
jgi:hypothetical protein